VLDSVTMMLAALVGAYVDDLRGASIAVAAQRLFSGMVDFSFAVRTLGGRPRDVAGFAARAFAPFWLPAAALLYFNQAHGVPAPDLHAAFLAALRTAGAIGIFTAMVYFIERRVITEVFDVLQRLVWRRAPVS
jgi:hypothetical protein